MFDFFLLTSIFIFGLIGESWMRISASASNLLRYLVFVDAYDENPVSHRYVVAKGISAKIAFLARDWYSLVILLLHQKSVNDILPNMVI